MASAPKIPTFVQSVYFSGFSPSIAPTKADLRNRFADILSRWAEDDLYTVDEAWIDTVLIFNAALAASQPTSAEVPKRGGV